MRTTNWVTLWTCVAVSLAAILVLPVHAYYIEITVPEENHTYRPCAPSEVRWNSDIPPEEGEVLEISWWGGFRYSLGTSINDGHHPWPDPPCSDVTGLYYELEVRYLSDPAVYDIVTFSTLFWYPESPYVIFIDFTGDKTTYGGEQAAIYAAQYTIVDAYVGVYIADDARASGLTEVSFALEVGPPSVFAPPGYVSLLPGNLTTGSWEDGITLHATDCIGSAGSVVYVAYISMFYLGGVGEVVIRDHPEYPKQVMDCGDPAVAHQYIVGSHGGIGGAPPDTPVEPASWGAIKAMYR